MIAASISFALALGCSLPAQDCPPDQMCVAEWDAARRLCPSEGRCVPRPAPTRRELWLPFPAGDRVICGKGALAHDTSHNACVASTRFAFDLISSAYDPPHLVVAAEDGTARVRGGCPSTDLNDQPAGEDRCNDGWGNFVRVQHDPGLYTQYAHLSAILVRDGDAVRRGQPIGIEGNSGAAGAKHLHFSAHAGDASVGGPSVPIAQLRLAGGQVVSSDQLTCGDWSHGKPVTAAMRLESGTPLLHQRERFGFRAEPPRVALLPRRCGAGLAPLARDPETCVALPDEARRRGAGVVLFLHGLYAPGASEEAVRVEEQLAREVTARGLALVAPRGRQGLCQWSADVRDAVCWPSGRNQAGAIAELAARLGAATDEVARTLGPGAHPRFVIGFSNGGFFGAALVADAAPGAFAGAAILAGPVLPSTFEPARAIPVLLVAAEEDRWQLPKMRELDRLLGVAGWPHTLRVRPGAHALLPEDVAAALEFLSSIKGPRPNRD
jgi:predicted esterase